MRVRVQCRPGQILRKPGPKRLRVVDTDEQTMDGLAGRPHKVAIRSGADYFTDEPEEVEMSSWLERMIRTGSLVIAPATAPRSPKPAAGSDKPVPLSE